VKGLAGELLDLADVVVEQDVGEFVGHVAVGPGFRADRVVHDDGPAIGHLERGCGERTWLQFVEFVQLFAGYQRLRGVDADVQVYGEVADLQPGVRPRVRAWAARRRSNCASPQPIRPGPIRSRRTSGRYARSSSPARITPTTLLRPRTAQLPAMCATPTPATQTCSPHNVENAPAFAARKGIRWGSNPSPKPPDHPGQPNGHSTRGRAASEDEPGHRFLQGERCQRSYETTTLAAPFESLVNLAQCYRSSSKVLVVKFACLIYSPQEPLIIAISQVLIKVVGHTRCEGGSKSNPLKTYEHDISWRHVRRDNPDASELPLSRGKTPVQ